MTNANPTQAERDQVIVEDLVKRFGRFTAVDHVSFRIGQGRIMGFLGPNGAGKSTIIRILCGLLRPTSGSVKVAGIDVAADPERVRERIGYMSQRFSLYRDLTVEENLRFFGGIYGVTADLIDERIRYAVEMAGLKGREGAITGTLAGGWQQRLALGCAVLHRPPILFLDEPTSGVEPASRRRFWDLIHEMAAGGVTVLVSTHYMDEAEYCHAVALINHGRLIAHDSPAGLRQTSLGGDLLLVECDHPGRALAALQQSSHTRNCSIFGSDIHCTVDRAEAGIAEVSALLAATGIAQRRIVKITPSLEDVFVHLVASDRSGRAAA